LKDTKRDDERATQALRATIERTKQIGQNHAANNAIIQEITCINFMCHKRLHVELGPLINFVVGHNGSGKSAVLTAITLCLGGKAAATNRGASLKSLIKEGEDTGLLIIRLKNEGNDAYQRDVYGDSIIIERQFSRTGTSGFKVKTALGRTISNKKGDVDDIVEYYQLQVDNPMNVLTQDAAKSFITASTPAQKYKFFKDGVQLSALDTDYNHLCNTCDQIEARFKESKDDLEILRKEAEVAKRRHQMLEENKDMRKRKREMGGQLAWAQVHDVELALEKRNAHVAEIQQEIDEAETIFNDKDVAFQGFENTLERAKESRKQLIEDMAPVKADEEAAKEAFDEAVAAVKSNRTDRATMKENVARAKQKVAKCIHDIEIENTRLEAANGGANARKVAEIEEARQKVIEARLALTNYTSELPSLRAKTDDIKQQINRIDGFYGNKRKDVEAAERQLASLNQNRGDQMAGFDPRMPGLLRAIRENNGFREKPVGPIGLHIKLKDAKWSNVLESVLNSVLTSFLVTNKADQARLSDLLVSSILELYS
jgi:chromosome segregation ATPase